MRAAKRADSCVRLCCGAAGNKIGEAGALAVSKALESGNCKLTSLDVAGESGMAVRCVWCCPWVCLWLDGVFATLLRFMFALVFLLSSDIVFDSTRQSYQR